MNLKIKQENCSFIENNLLINKHTQINKQKDIITV